MRLRQRGVALLGPVSRIWGCLHAFPAPPRDPLPGPHRPCLSPRTGTDLASLRRAPRRPGELMHARVLVLAGGVRCKSIAFEGHIRRRAVPPGRGESRCQPASRALLRTRGADLGRAFRAAGAKVMASLIRSAHTGSSCKKSQLQGPSMGLALPSPHTLRGPLRMKKAVPSLACMGLCVCLGVK